MSILILPLLRAFLMGCFLVLPIEGLLKLNFYTIELTRSSFGVFLLTVPVVIWIAYYVPFLFLFGKNERFSAIRELSATLWPQASAAIVLTLIVLFTKLTLTWVIATLVLSILVSLLVFIYEIRLFGQRISEVKGFSPKKSRITAALIFVIVPVVVTLIVDAVI